MLLTRNQSTSYGVFGKLTYADHVFYTLEHAFLVNDQYVPKLPTQHGAYVCRRGIHKLHDLVPFETFEITGVEGHTGILFHVGNWNRDSDGCVLLGLGMNLDAITQSKPAFKSFMDSLQGIDEFVLEVM